MKKKYFLITSIENVRHFFKLQMKWKLIKLFSVNKFTYSLTCSSIRIMHLNPIWSLSPGSGFVLIDEIPYQNVRYKYFILQLWWTSSNVAQEALGEIRYPHFWNGSSNNKKKNYLFSAEKKLFGGHTHTPPLWTYSPFPNSLQLFRVQYTE